MNNFTNTTSRVAIASAFALTALAGAARADAMSDLAVAATKEGALTVIALPHDWCGYGDVIAGFKAKYPGIAINELEGNIHS